MKRLVRADPPESWDGKNPGAKSRIFGWYESVLTSNNIPSRWITEDVDDEGDSIVRKHLLDMTRNCCAYCGKRISRECEIDHYLPKKAFQFVAYCWYNYLPACKSCNGSKLNYIPPSLNGTQIIDSILQDDSRFQRDSHLVYDENLFAAIEERLFHPMIDEPGEHFSFETLELRIRSKGSEIGTITVGRLFKKEKRFAEEILPLITYIELQLRAGVTSEKLITEFSAAVGYEFIIREIVEFYAEFDWNN